MRGGGDGGVKTDGELKKVRDNANEERRSEGREMGQSAEERISGLNRNAPAMPHKCQKRRGKGEDTEEERRERRGNWDTKNKCEKEEDGKKQIPPSLICSLSGDFMIN